MPGPGALTALTVGFVLVVIGLWLLRWRGHGPRNATRTSVGLVVLLGGYHTAAWFGPAGWFWLAVPPRLWPVAAGGAAVLVVGSLVLDRVERRAARPG